jgi:hypothetical protein
MTENRIGTFFHFASLRAFESSVLFPRRGAPMTGVTMLGLVCWELACLPASRYSSFTHERHFARRAPSGRLPPMPLSVTLLQAALGHAPALAEGRDAAAPGDWAGGTARRAPAV